jgi:outer membrane receptor protein involved in Fe transport
MNKGFLAGAIALTSSWPGLAFSSPDDELAEIRRQMEALRKAYEERLQELEDRLQKAEESDRRNQAELENKKLEQQTAVETEQAGVPKGRAPVTSNRFNPAISVVLQGSLNSYSQDPDDYAVPGFQLGDEAGPAPEGFTLDETEIRASANVDHLFYAETTIGLHDGHDETEVEIEEAFIDPLALPAGFGGRFGRFYSGIGYLNKIHTHAWDFHDEPLAYRTFLGKQYGDDGIRLDWLAPTDLYLLIGGEAFAGKNFPAGDPDRTLGDVQSAYLKIGGDLGISHAWQAGLSGLWADANDREGRGHDHAGGGSTSTRFSGDSNLFVADFVWKWAPDGNPRQRNLKLQSEFFYREEDGDVLFSEDGAEALLNYDGDQKGWYAQAVYQFMPRWRFGLRYDWLNADNDLSVIDPGGFADPDEALQESGLRDDGDPERWSAMFDWSPSEFSRLRLQYNRDESRPQNTDNQWSLQYIMSIGSHGAHEF